MGAAVDQGGNKLNTELNLVPFIDLLSSLVLFLLVTEVWMQVGTITVSGDSKGKAVQTSASKPTLFVHLTARGYDLNLANGGDSKVPKFIAKMNGEFNQDKLIADLKQIFANHMPSLAAVSSDDEITYKQIIHTVDAMKQIGLPSVALSTD